MSDRYGPMWFLIFRESRNIPVEKVNKLADNLAANNAADALQNKLIDGVIYRDALIDTLKSLSGIRKE